MTDTRAGGASHQALSTLAASLGPLSTGWSRHRRGRSCDPSGAQPDLLIIFISSGARSGRSGSAIEDLHWLDHSTRELLAFLVRNAQAERLSSFVTFRSDGAHAATSASLLAGPACNAHPGSSGSSWAGLSPWRSTPANLPASSGSRPARHSSSRSTSASEGNPFPSLKSSSRPVPGRVVCRVTLREGIGQRFAHVSEPTVRLLGVAAVVGRKVDHHLLARLSDLSERVL